MEKKNYTVKDWPDEERPRERLVKYGVEYLTDAELLGIILVSGYQGKTSVELAKDLLSETKTLRKLDALSFTEVKSFKGIGLAKFAQIKAAMEIGKRLLRETSLPKKKVHNAVDLVNYYGPCMRDLKKEKFKAILLDVKNKIIRDIEISEGSLTESIVHPREVLKEIIKESAASVIFLHNHPSGESNPSKNDLDTTERLVEACNIIGVKVLDHIILGEDNHFSFAQEGLLHKEQGVKIGEE
ncbi:JAB domain-containing protein [Candidatus Atribacteria bacterium MT.SAG.1]|nr:JAB domain-containing protein [Candidatus Atribacteria bacterium MT.SAG.1]